MRVRRGLIALAVLGSAMVGLASPAAGVQTTGDAAVNHGDAGITAYVLTWMGGGPSRPGGMSCDRWRIATQVDVDREIARTGGAGGFDLKQFRGGYRWRLHIRYCGPDRLTPQTTMVPVDVDDEVVDAVVVLAQAHGKVPAPQPAFAPPADKMIVNLGTWFWDTGEHWSEDHHPTIRVGFPNYRIRVEAIPRTLTYNSGLDGLTTTCNGPGNVWLPEYGDEPDTHCMFTYEHSSVIAPDGTDTFHATLSLDWDIRIYLNDALFREPETLTTRTTFDVTVKEYQAIIVPND